MLPVTLALALLAGALAAAVVLVWGVGPAPLDPDSARAWKEKSPLAPPPRCRQLSPSVRSGLLWYVTAAVPLGCALFIVGGVANRYQGYRAVAALFTAAIVLMAVFRLVRARERGEPLLPRYLGLGRAAREARRWEVIEAYAECLAGEAATGHTGQRGELERQARRIFRTAEEQSFLRGIRSRSGSEEFRQAAAAILEDLAAAGVLRPEA